MRGRTVFAAMLAGMLAISASGALAGDPFDDARYYIGIDDAKTLALADSGQFDVNMANPEGLTLLHYAADANRLDLVKALLARGANPDAKTNRGSTPYDMATAALVKAALKAKMAAAPAALAPAVAAPPKPAAQSTAPSLSDTSPYKKECQQKWHADQALCSDTTCKMTAYRKWATCLKTGRYW